MRRFLPETSGAAALELALWVGILVVPIMNVMDVGLYLFRRVQVENAAQIAVQAAWKACDEAAKQRPVTTNCQPNGQTLTDYVRSIAQASTSLTTSVTVGTPAAKYFCLNDSNALVEVTAPVTQPGSCSSERTVAPIPAPGEYVEVTTSYSYTPMFGPVSVASIFAAPMTYTARARVS